MPDVPPSPASTPHGSSPLVVLTGNPNCGKTTLFNALTGLRGKVGNYAGVTVERKEGRLLQSPAGLDVTILDLPGTYSLSPQSLDEQISRDILFHRLDEVSPPNLVVVVVDASNLERNLYYAGQVIELGYPTILALNMTDVAEANGQTTDAGALSRELGIPVVPLVASSGAGIQHLAQLIVSTLQSAKPPAPRPFCRTLDPRFIEAANRIGTILRNDGRGGLPGVIRADALLRLTDARQVSSPGNQTEAAIAAERASLEASGLDWRSAVIEARYQDAAAVRERVTQQLDPGAETSSDRLDRILTHRVWGTLVFIALMGLMFQSIFTLARIPMDALQELVEWVAGRVGAILPPGDLNSLLTDGGIMGVGAVVVFLPQILLLFLFIGLLEDTGYMARAAFLMDRLMSRVGLHGKSFIPLLSSFACAIPGIMATRTIETPKDRLITLLVAPLMSCSARLPVYTMLIAACIPDTSILGVFKLSGLVLLGMYLLGIIVALIMAWIFKRTLLRGHVPMLILELPPYRRPVLRVVARHMWERSKVFLRRAGTVILGINILLWFLANFPAHSAFETQHAAATQALLKEAAANTANGQPLSTDLQRRLTDSELTASGERLRNSFAGRLGRVIEPVLAPLGFDWKIGIGIVASFAAREVFVSTMSTVYNVGSGKSARELAPSLSQTLRAQRKPDGTPVYTIRSGVTLMVFYVFALQCVSTVAVVRRETGSWKWPLFQWAYMGALAWGLAFLTSRLLLTLGIS